VPLGRECRKPVAQQKVAVVPENSAMIHAMTGVMMVQVHKQQVKVKPAHG
jgi:hypothetical protein